MGGGEPACGEVGARAGSQGRAAPLSGGVGTGGAGGGVGGGRVAARATAAHCWGDACFKYPSS